MKRGLAVAVAVAGGWLAAQVAASAPPAGPEALVESERAFARDVAASSVRDGFLHWLAPTAVVFAPGPVNAHQLYAARKATPARLAWQPAVAVMSAAGDLGWTTGPWQWRADSTHRDPQATGSFVTLWRRQDDGGWRAVLDMGVTHDSVPGAGATVDARQLAGVSPGRGALSRRHMLWKADADYAALARSQGLAAALATSGAPGVRWLREGAQPVVGREAARDSAEAARRQGRMMSLAQFIADSGDLGYTYGTLVEGGATARDTSHYLHIWERVPGQTWRLVLELLAPVPKPAK